MGHSVQEFIHSLTHSWYIHIGSAMKQKVMIWFGSFDCPHAGHLAITFA